MWQVFDVLRNSLSEAKVDNSTLNQGASARSVGLGFGKIGSGEIEGPEDYQPVYHTFRIRIKDPSVSKAALKTWLNKLPYDATSIVQDGKENVKALSLESRPDDKGLVATVTFRKIPISFKFKRSADGNEKSFDVRIGDGVKPMVVDSHFDSITPLYSCAEPKVE
ncbi:hypothetical protein FPQ18DRAFT_417648 [Pyronema domesticum]|nr:hypothetical protein FPQ18DRAFT_417648 [Pyronema domesticum]